MAKVQIKSEQLTPFGGIFSIMEQFDSMLSPIIDRTLGRRCSSIIGYKYSEIVRSLMSVYFCGGSCVEDVTSHLMRHLSYHPTLRTCSSDTILRAIKELKSYIEEHHHCPNKHCTLYNAQKYYRRKMKDGTLDEEKARELEEILNLCDLGAYGREEEGFATILRQTQDRFNTL